jgi:hypothetical protein
MGSGKISFEAVFSTIGEVCAIWAEIDFYVGELLHDLYAYHDAGRMTQTGSDALGVIIRSMDIRQKADAVRALSLAVKEDPDFFEDTKSAMKEITEELRNARNRLVHDDWVHDAQGGIVQTQYVAKVRRPRPREWALQLRQETEHEDASQLEAHLNRFRVALDNVNFLRHRVVTVITKLDQT